MYALTPFPITPIGNFIGVVLALLPLLSNIRKLSLAVWGYAIWIAIIDFQTFVNTIIWHDNVDIVAAIWCDIVTKLQIGAGVGTRACTLVICLHLYRKTHMRGPVENTSNRKRLTVICELSLILALPIIVMALLIVVQPLRFEIDEELGCSYALYSYVGYILLFVPLLTCNIACVILAPLTLRTFLRHHKEMNESLSSSRDATHNKYQRYQRLMIIACLDTAFNLPVLVINLVTAIVEGKGNVLNYPYVSWKNVHDGAGGLFPGLSLSSIEQVPASEWSTDRWEVFNVKWNEWVYVVHAAMFFCVFGTAPEMRSYYRAAFWFLPERLGYKKRQPSSELETVSDVVFNSNPGQKSGDRPAPNKRRGSLSLLEATIDSASGTHSTAPKGPFGCTRARHAARILRPN